MHSLPNTGSRTTAPSSSVKARGISQEELAEANAYDRFYLNGLEAGRSTLQVTRVLRTLKSLGITLTITFDPGENGPADA